MAFLPIAHVAINYRDYPSNWIKAYEVGTTTPKPMALMSDGTSQVAKLEVNADGFLVSSGDALVIPYISGLFDMYLFPTEAEADANETINAIRIADGSQGEGGSTISDTIELTDGQTTVTLSSVMADTAIIYIQGQNVDQGKLLKDVGTQVNDYSVTDGSTIELTRSYPDGSFISALGFTEIESGEVISVHGRTGAVASANGDYTASQITNVPAGNVSSTEVQGAINELDTGITTNTSNISTNAAAITSLKKRAPVSGVSTTPVGFDYFATANATITMDDVTGFVGGERFSIVAGKGVIGSTLTVDGSDDEVIEPANGNPTDTVFNLTTAGVSFEFIFNAVTGNWEV
tara:strand:- start:5964 stop:7004 length:1041 start_codon:yes stop_codon:yes gene_type:complete